MHDILMVFKLHVAIVTLRLVLATDLSSNSPHLQSTGSQDGQLGDRLRLELLQSEDGGDRETASHYHVGGWGGRGGGGEGGGEKG